MVQHIREKLQGREIQPSASAWERLSSQLDDAKTKKKRHWFFYVGYAASILLVVALFVFLTQSSSEDSQVNEDVYVNDEVNIPSLQPTETLDQIPVEEVIVEKSEDKKQIEKPMNIKPDVFKVPVKSEGKTVIAKQNTTEKFDINVQEKIKELSKEKETVVVKIDTSQFKSVRKSNTGIYVDSDALLMSVTGTKDEIQAYYKKYKIDREEVLLAIKKELKKSSLKVDPETILAEVELDVNEENFQNNFYQFIKKRVSTVATAIANRNN